MRTITISISVPDGVDFRVVSGPPPDDFEHEPLPDPTRFGPDAELPPNGHVNGQPAVAVAPARIWQVDDIHAQGHKPLKKNSRGLFCPTSMGKDAAGKTLFCQWRP